MNGRYQHLGFFNGKWVDGWPIVPTDARASQQCGRIALFGVI
jgi:hypothetical protein